MLVAMSTQLHSGPSPGLKDVHPFIDAAMVQVTRRDILDFFYWLPLMHTSIDILMNCFYLAGKFFGRFGCSQTSS